MNPRFTLARFPSENALAEAVAMRWLDQLAADTAARHNVAVSGGRITRQFFTSLARREAIASKSLSRVEFFWADERCVPPSDPESNFGMTEKLLLAPLGIPAERVHRIAGEMERGQAAREAEKELRRVTATEAPRIPVLDLVFLGMGEDGHVASLFPGTSPAAVPNSLVYQAVVATKPPPERVTLTYEAIAAAREVWAIVSGHGKSEALSESLREGGGTPLARVIQMRERTMIFTDVALSS